MAQVRPSISHAGTFLRDESLSLFEKMELSGNQIMTMGLVFVYFNPTNPNLLLTRIVVCTPALAQMMQFGS